MSKRVQTFRNPLILLALGACVSTAGADQARTVAASVHHAVNAPVPSTLDLTPPDIRDVMSVDEWSVPLPDPDESEFTGPNAVQVQVAAPSPYVPGGFEALWWGMLHPGQAWRILTPAQ
jgi:hypothetical protein